MELECFSLRDEKEISSYLDLMARKDIHCDTDYLRLFERYLGAELLYFHFRKDSESLMIPYFRLPVENCTDLISA